MKILSNKKYKEMSENLKDLNNQVSILKEDYDDLWISYSQVFKSKDDEIAKLNNKIDTANGINKMREEMIADLVATIDKLKAENKSLKSAKGGYARVMNKLKKNLEETQKKLEESMTDKYLVKKVPMGKLPKGQVMKMKSHAKQDKIIQKIYEKMEKDEI